MSYSIPRGLQTLAIHAGEQPDPITGASAPNLVMSTTFVVDPDVSFSAEDFGEKTPFVYGRWGNPTVDQLERKLAVLEGGESAVAFASGMAAIAGLLTDPDDEILFVDYNTPDDLPTFPEAIAIGITSQVVAKLFPRIGPRRLLASGFTGLALTCGALARAGDTTSLWEIRCLCFALGIFVAFIMLPSQTSAFAQITPAETGHASAIFNTLQRALASLGVAVLATVLSLGGGDVVHRRPSMAAFHWVFAANVTLAAAGAALSLRIRDADAASAMGARRPPSQDADETTASAKASS